MQITIKLKLVPTKEQKILIDRTMEEYISTANRIVSELIENPEYKPTSKTIKAMLPSALRDQCRLDAKSVVKKYKKECRKADVWNKKQPMDNQKTAKVPILKKPVAIWNNQNYKIKDTSISFPVLVEGKSQRLNVRAILPGDILEKLNKSKLGTLRMSYVNNKLIAQIAVGVVTQKSTGNNSMGIDVGLKVPAVAVTDKGKTRFFGNGRMNKYIKRKFRAKRKELGKAKKLNAIRKLNDKEQRWMKDQDHKISREIVDFAKQNNVSTIRLEKLSGIRQTARTSRKNEKNLHTWSFYRLAGYIEYKALLEGIKIEYVDPKHTSQICPECGTLNKAKDRKYKCACGYKTHRDRLGAINIINAPMVDGNSLSA